MANYIDRFRKKETIKGATPNKAFQNSTERLINKDFIYDFAYRKATLYKIGMESEDIDLKETNIERTVFEKLLIFRPNTNIVTGEYFAFHQRNDDSLPMKTYIAMEVQDNSLAPTAKCHYCNQTLRWLNNEKGIPAIFADSSYGSKGVVHNNEQLVDFDSRGVITVQRNKLTEDIFEGMRFILGSKWDIFTVTKKKGCKVDNIWELTVQYVKALQEDDFANNIAFNKELDKEISIIDHVILGEEELKINTISEYKLNLNDINVTWSIDIDSITYGVAEMVSQDSLSCKVKALLPDEYFVLTATDSATGVVVATMPINTIKK